MHTHKTIIVMKTPEKKLLAMNWVTAYNKLVITLSCTVLPWMPEVF